MRNKQFNDLNLDDSIYLSSTCCPCRLPIHSITPDTNFHNSVKALPALNNSNIEKIRVFT